MQDHPRLCGEKLGFLGCPAFRIGSPPPMRGKVLRWEVLFLHSGITPAYAGKSFHFFGSRCSCRDHPRLCGEKPQTGIVKYISIGSPPPMRGKVRLRRLVRQCRRITPAYAGKRQILQKKRHIGIGSPPPMRGKGLAFRCVSLPARITPAYAGKRSRLTP